MVTVETNKQSDGDVEEKPPTENRKREDNGLRYMEADLEVVVGTEIQDDGSAIFWHLSPVLASQSRYVDTLLSTSVGDINLSENHKRIEFPNITPSQWERMIELITNPLVLESVTRDEAMELAPLYDQYDFPMGLKICDEILYKKTFFRSSGNKFRVLYADVKKTDFCVNAIVLSRDINLKKTFHWGRVWLEYIFLCTYQDPCHFPFKRSNIVRLMPAIIRDGELSISDESEFLPKLSETVDGHDSTPKRYRDNDAINKHLDNGEEISIHLKKTIERLLLCPTDDLTNQMFPDLLLATLENLMYHSSAEIISMVTILFPHVDHPAAGVYKEFGKFRFTRMGLWGHAILRRDHRRLWQLVVNGSVLYECESRDGHFSHFPPQTGWVAVNDTHPISSAGGPKIMYSIPDDPDTDS